MNVDGLPVSYLARRIDQYRGEYDVEVRARDAAGRPRVIHVFDGMPGTTRGISPLTPVLQVAKQFDQLADATLVAAILQTVFAAVITGDRPTEEQMQGFLNPQELAEINKSGGSLWDAVLDASAGWYDAAALDVGMNGRIAHMFPGDKLEFKSSEHPNGNYKDFAYMLLREFARCAGLTFESATGDYSDATYSSVRMATNEIFSLTLYRRKNIIAPLLGSIYTAWLEEEIDRGGIPFPGGIDRFLEHRSAASRAIWRGSPKPQADDLKTAKAHEIWARLGVMSDEMIATDLGVDIEDVYMQRSREQELRAEYDLPEPTFAGAAPARDVADNEENAA